jgi:von Willebrand factor type A domain
MKALNHVDLCFVVDTTGSMGNFIKAAQEQLLNTIKSLSANNSINLQIGLVEYRDHPPQDRTFITRVYPLTANLQQMQQVINKLRADGGGDAPEAVYNGVDDACKQMKWRAHSCRFILLVGDAPPHGFAKWLQEMMPDRRFNVHGDTWANGCPSGLNVQSVTAMAENYRVIIHALCMGGDVMTKEAFSALATLTGGQCVNASNAQDVISQIVTMLTLEFQNLEFDQKVLNIVQEFEQIDISKSAEVLDSPRLPVAAAIARLGKRGFL